jgi:hypothetical protein
MKGETMSFINTDVGFTARRYVFDGSHFGSLEFEDEHMSTVLTYLRDINRESADSIDSDDQSERPSEMGVTYAN